ncbi:hypothetical protein B0T17DRAFT_309782 [Bombardia bombarda]|uniref:Uncharacterized protein n=1 Tax=Bombardia bombarda TaxID=252184 RepID=A0AA40C1Y1_9PEZI|nr:hypothetical protein B0T17DRAFT_309782 [Bombardia bombarda]
MGLGVSKYGLPPTPPWPAKSWTRDRRPDAIGFDSPHPPHTLPSLGAPHLYGGQGGVLYCLNCKRSMDHPHALLCKQALFPHQVINVPRPGTIHQTGRQCWPWQYGGVQPRFLVGSNRSTSGDHGLAVFHLPFSFVHSINLHHPS